MARTTRIRSLSIGGWRSAQLISTCGSVRRGPSSVSTSGCCSNR
jgi:hypothetical protein